MLNLLEYWESQRGNEPVMTKNIYASPVPLPPRFSVGLAPPPCTPRGAGCLPGSSRLGEPRRRADSSPVIPGAAVGFSHRLGLS